MHMMYNAVPTLPHMHTQSCFRHCALAPLTADRCYLSCITVVILSVKANVKPESSCSTAKETTRKSH